MWEYRYIIPAVIKIINLVKRHQTLKKNWHVVFCKYTFLSFTVYIAVNNSNKILEKISFEIV